MDTSRELAAGLQGILKLCLAATTDCPPQPPTWLPVTLRIARCSELDDEGIRLIVTEEAG